MVEIPPSLTISPDILTIYKHIIICRAFTIAIGVKNVMKHEIENVDKVLLENDLVAFHKADRVHMMDKPHFHDGYEVHFTLTNSTTYQVDDRRSEADAGSIALFTSEEIHRVSIDSNKLYERYFILFKPSFIEDFTSSYQYLLEVYHKFDCIQLNEEDKVKMIRLFDELIEANNKNDDMSTLLAKIKLIEILILLNERTHTNEQIMNDSDSLQQNSQSMLSEIIYYMKENYMHEITLDMLSDHFFVSKSTIIRSFKSSLGMTPNQYLIYTRIMKSRDYLKQGYSVKEVSMRVGYKDESSYIKKFKELLGSSPKQYALNN